MKLFQYITITLFILASTLVGMASYGQTKEKERYFLISWISLGESGHYSYSSFSISSTTLPCKDSLQAILYRQAIKSDARHLSIEYYQITGIYEFKNKREMNEFYQTKKP